MTAVPVVFAVARVRPGGRFTYTTPRWPDARGYLVGLLEQHATAATAAAAADVARRARAAVGQVPTAPPAGTWRVQLGECRYQLDRQDLGPAPGAHAGKWKSVPPPALTAAHDAATRPAPAGRRPTRQWRN